MRDWRSVQLSVGGFSEAFGSEGGTRVERGFGGRE